MSRAVLLVLLVVLPACSFIAAAGGGYTPPCKKSMVPAVVDTTVAVAAVGTCLFGATVDLSNEGNGNGVIIPLTWLCVVPGLLAVPYGLSANRGFSGDRACR